MKNKTARRILDNTPQEVKDEVSLAAQELIDSANREHEEDFTCREYNPHEEFDMLIREAKEKEIHLEKLKEVLEKFDVRKHLCIGGWGYSTIEREIVNTLVPVNTYTREEVYAIAERVALEFITQSLDPTSEEYPLEDIINSEIDTVKLF